MRKAKILATLGPATESREVIEQMLAAGLNAVRINMSHGTHDQHKRTVDLAREAAHSMNVPLSILVDLSGPKIRTRTLHDGIPVVLVQGETFVLTTSDTVGDHKRVGTNCAALPNAVEVGSRILLDDGAIELSVMSKTDTDVVTTVVTGGVLSERKGINLPNTPLPIPSMTEKDHADLVWAMEQNVDYVALSFVRTAQDCIDAKELIKKLSPRTQGRALLVAKI